MARLYINGWCRWQTALDESRYDAAKMASRLGVSRRQLYRYTIAAFDRGPQEWLNDLRLMAAGPMLVEFRSVKEVAFNLGFKQISHFSREFKLFYGLPPIAFLAWADRQKSGFSAQTKMQGKTNSLTGDGQSR